MKLLPKKKKAKHIKQIAKKNEQKQIVERWSQSLCMDSIYSEVEMLI